LYNKGGKYLKVQFFCSKINSKHLVFVFYSFGIFCFEQTTKKLNIQYNACSEMKLHILERKLQFCRYWDKRKLGFLTPAVQESSSGIEKGYELAIRI
jgi:hypothetical protein